MNTGKKVAIVAIILVFFGCAIYLAAQLLSIFNSAKKLDSSKMPDSIVTESSTAAQETPVPEETSVPEEEVKETYVSPYGEDYGKSLETVFVDAIQNKDSNVYKSILNNCEKMGYQIILSATNGYTISARNNSIDALTIVVDNATDKVKGASLLYADMLSLTYNPNSTKGEYIFENTEQGRVEYFDNVIEATDNLLSEINSHKYDPNAVLASTGSGSNWAASVTPTTDFTQFTGTESLDEITVPAYFDANYYSIMNPDVVMIFGNDPRALYRHYIMHGRAEGRQYALDISGAFTVNQVYITSIGTHYHKSNCKFIEGDANAVTLDYATQNNYKQCPICNP